MKYIFLDFDGVLHGTKYNTEHFCLLDNFENRLKPYEDKFKIVISSSWRLLYPLENLKEVLFLQLKNIIGVTPDLSHLNEEEERYYEFRKYCTDNKINIGNCCCVDDSETLFPAGFLLLLLTNTETGITDKDIDKLILFITENR